MKLKHWLLKTKTTKHNSNCANTNYFHPAYEKWVKQLGTLMFMCPIFPFADDAKLFKHVRSAEDSAVLQKSCDRLFQWLNQWLLKLNVDKCKVLSIGLRNTTNFTYYLGDVNDQIELERTSSMKDLVWSLIASWNSKCILNRK